MNKSLKLSLMAAVVTASLVILVLLSVDLPVMQRIFTPTAPTSRGGTGAPFYPHR